MGTNSSPTGRTNTRLKVYPGKTIIQVSNDHIFPRDPNSPQTRPYNVPPPGKAKDPQRALEAGRRRAAAKVRDIALCNSFEYFFTWTLDGRLLDRYDAKAVYAKVRAMLSNATARKNFSYILIPEYHEKKEREESPAIHMHGLCNLGRVPIVRSVTSNGQPRADKNGRPVYNMPSWTWGFSTCVPLDSHYERAVNYVCKYLTKANSKIFGKWYLSSRNLIKSPEVIPIEPINYMDFRDTEKLDHNEQFECSLYSNVKLLTEEFPRLEDMS